MEMIVALCKELDPGEQSSAPPRLRVKAVAERCTSADLQTRCARSGWQSVRSSRSEPTPSALVPV